MEVRLFRVLEKVTAGPEAMFPIGRYFIKDIIRIISILTFVESAKIYL
jgi:hypothetical protein